MSIHPILQKIKTLTENIEVEAILMVIIIILAALAGFGLGRLSNSGEGNAVIIQTGVGTETPSPVASLQTQNIAGAQSAIQTNIVASKNGTKYYLSGCSGVGRIQDQNKVYFYSEQEAIDAGYTKASGCK